VVVERWASREAPLQAVPAAFSAPFAVSGGLEMILLVRLELATVARGVGVARSARLVEVAVCVLAAIALSLGFVDLGAKSLWLDEAIGVERAANQDLLSALFGGHNMGLYTVLLHFWIRMFGDSETAARSLSVCFAALCVPAVFLVGRRLFDRRTGLIAAVVLVPNAFLLSWAQQARSYTLLILLVTLSSYFFLGELEQPSWTNRLLYVVSSALAVDAHYFGAFVVAAQLLTVLVLRRRGAFTEEWLGVGVAIALLCLPEVHNMLRRGAEPLSWISRPRAVSLYRVSLDLAGGSRLVLAILIAACLFAVVRAVVVSDPSRESFLATWLLLPILISFAASFVQPMFVSRYLAVSLPALVLLAARGLAKLPVPALAAIGVLAVVWASGGQVSVWYGTPGQEDWRNATRFVLASTRAADTVVIYPRAWVTPFEYYERRDEGVRPASVVTKLPDLQPRSRSRVWVVLRTRETARRQGLRMFHALNGYCLSAQRGFARIRVELYFRTLRFQRPHCPPPSPAA
jgi:mannosyltransferase